MFGNFNPSAIVNEIYDILEKNAVMGVTGAFVSQKTTNFMKLKNRGNPMGIDTKVCAFLDELGIPADFFVSIRVNNQGD